MQFQADRPAQTSPTGELHGSAIIREIKASGIEFLVTVPDITTSENLLRPLSKDPHFQHVRVCREDEAIAVASSLSVCNRRALVLIQHTGLLDSINAIRGVAVEHHFPVCMMVGLLAKEPELLPQQSKKYGVRIVEPILDDMGVDRHLLQTDADLALIKPAIDAAYAGSRPTVILIGRSPKP
jgi:sulfopyruvate decarboxylase subunit alpha